MIISESLRALFSRVGEPPSWRAIQYTHAAIIVACSVFAYMAQDRFSAMLNAFLVGASFSSVGYIGAVRHYQSLVNRMREHMRKLQAVLGPLEGRVFMMQIVPADDDSEERPTIN